MIASVIMLFFRFISPQVVKTLLSVEIVVVVAIHKATRDIVFTLELKFTIISGQA